MVNPFRKCLLSKPVWDYHWESGNWSSTGLVRLVSSQHRVAINEGNVVGKILTAAPVLPWFPPIPLTA